MITKCEESGSWSQSESTLKDYKLTLHAREQARQACAWRLLIF